MPGMYSICLNPSVPPVQHSICKVPIHYKEKREDPQRNGRPSNNSTCYKTNRMVSSLTYPTKPDGSLRICLDTHDLNKAIIREHYKAPTLEETSPLDVRHYRFSKMDVKDGFWSIHLDIPSYYSTPFNTHKADTDS